MARHCKQGSNPYKTYSIVSVPDGDSLEVIRYNTFFRVRLAGIDCPERGQNEGGNWGTKARDALAMWCPPKSPVDLLVSDTDRHGRLIAEAWLSGGIFVQELLVASGLAYPYPEFRHQCQHFERLVVARNRARAMREGFWALPEGDRPDPKNYRKEHPR